MFGTEPHELDQRAVRSPVVMRRRHTPGGEPWCGPVRWPGVNVLAWGVSIPLLVLLLIALALLERVYRRARKAQKDGGLPMSGVAYDELTAFLYGTKRNEIEERTTQSLMAEDDEDGAPPNQIDLDGNRVIMKRRDTNN
ncbi:DUF6191 domain-containing protein [Kibdelosporangium lantanae]|uniref:DUF6191 domain-containing protein n=1 Tax=Kibdelosporangium lantanae TaxID=1497396 RepID=A0ABW3MF84_9PSEU